MPDQLAVEAAESWFGHPGLPYFVDDVRAVVAARLSRPRVALVALVAAVVGAIAREWGDKAADRAGHAVPARASGGGHLLPHQ